MTTFVSIQVNRYNELIELWNAFIDYEPKKGYMCIFTYNGTNYIYENDYDEYIEETEEIINKYKNTIKSYKNVINYLKEYLNDYEIIINKLNNYIIEERHYNYLKGCIINIKNFLEAHYPSKNNKKPINVKKGIINYKKSVLKNKKYNYNKK
jgi:hypothetical protein